VDMIVTEREYLHNIPPEPYSALFGQSRSVSWSSTVTFSASRYLVPAGSDLQRVGFARLKAKSWSSPKLTRTREGRELARHLLLGPGQASIENAHYPDRPES